MASTSVQLRVAKKCGNCPGQVADTVAGDSAVEVEVYSVFRGRGRATRSRCARGAARGAAFRYLRLAIYTAHTIRPDPEFLLRGDGLGWGYYMPGIPPQLALSTHIEEGIFYLSRIVFVCERLQFLVRGPSQLFL
jgi:hypothetical protein